MFVSSLFVSPLFPFFVFLFFGMPRCFSRLIFLDRLDPQLFQLSITGHLVNQSSVVILSNFLVFLRFTIKLFLLLLGGGKSILETKKLLRNNLALKKKKKTKE